MSYSEQEAKVREVLHDILGVEAPELTRTSLLIDDHGADSLAAVEVLSHLEVAFDVEIDPKAGPRMVNIDAILEVLDECGAK
ncbi:acyl carrier protein [Streptomyces albipurpureus]|uniref:Phosphopantetheine-binding protein n=1 Tax=Streptomyces albipurpureus TaxID=2897419 RepID=A0ABT0UJT0_9ACTN|nr:phosphopantetheine-binding protein [Streptomyces sp. CWNU-1]MCM2387668.1 phosphopantetheine-binding protein [Streptomyces sp. CWNU-1]